MTRSAAHHAVTHPTQPRTEAMHPMLETYWSEAAPFEAFLETVSEKADLWRSHARRVKLHEDELARVRDLSYSRKLLVLTEDWCGDAIRSLPVVAALAAESPGLELRVLNTDAHPEALSGRLTKGARAIPIVVLFDEEGREIGSWGPRPAPLQAQLREKLRTEGPPPEGALGEYYAPIFSWYAKDKGRTVAQELLMLLERGS